MAPAPRAARSAVGDGCDLGLGSRQLGQAADDVDRLGVGFWPYSGGQLLAMAGVDLLFVGMNSAALNRGVFAFDHPDGLGMPVYEYLMWGFYTLHTIRFLDGAAPRGRLVLVLAAAAAFGLPFALIADPTPLLAASVLALAAALGLFHQPMDFAYAGYMAALGGLIEYVGVSTGQWHYRGQNYGGVPLWSFAMWAAVGLFTRRLVLPLLEGSTAGSGKSPPPDPLPTGHNLKHDDDRAAQHSVRRFAARNRWRRPKARDGSL